MTFSYEEFSQRNIGFVTEDEQRALRVARVLVLGVGGMGGACVQTLARAGVGQLGLADFDVFDVSNLNRQVFATMQTVGQPKVEATAAQLRLINPEIRLELLGEDWPKLLDQLLGRYKIVINGMDDIAAGIVLYRKARAHGATVIDAYTSTLPSVTVVRPGAARPEERLGYPTRGIDAAAIDSDVAKDCMGLEIEYVMVHSSTAKHVDLEVASQLLSGKRKRMSFAPMVITTGNLMAYEAIKLILGRQPAADERGYFFNPWTMRVERPRHPVVAGILRVIVRRFIARMLAQQGTGA
jgi:molybdopterin/thiamine biosynthesis adenylyltransferase